MTRRILLVDDHPVVRQGLRLILEGSDMPVQVQEAGNGDEALREICSASWDAVILDLGLPDRNGVEVLRQMKRYRPSLPVLVLTMQPEDQFGVRLIRAGASGYLTKAAAPEKLLAAIRQLLNGKRYVTAKLADMLADELAESQQHPRHTALSDREYQIFLLLASGKTSPEIAKELSLNVKTVYTYRERILEKMGMKDIAALASYAFEQGLLHDRRRSDEKK